MTNPVDQSVAYRVVMGMAAFVVVVAGMRAAQSVIVPFLLACFTAIICAPYLNWLQRKGVPSIVALIIVVLGILAVGIGLGAVLGSSLDAFSQALPSYQARLEGEVTRLISWLKGFGIELSEKTFRALIDPGSAMRLASSLLKGLGNVLANAFLILLTVVFMLMEVSTFASKLRHASGRPEHSLEDMYQIMDNIKRYMSIKVLTSILTGFLITVGLSLLGVDFPLLWGFFAFLLNFIPNIGSFIAAVPAILIALLQLGLGVTFMTGLLYLVVNVMVGSFLEPRWMGESLGVSPLVVFLSLVFWGWVFGPVGMFLSVPLTISVQIAMASSNDSQWIAVLLGPGTSDKTA